MAYTGTLERRRRSRAAPAGRLVGIGVALAVTLLAVSPIAYMLWPAAAPVSPDAPSLPITVGTMAFNVPPAAIRFRVQRHAGAQPRVDLAFLWPSLRPPGGTIDSLAAGKPDIADRLFVTIAADEMALPPLERSRTIYPQYLEATPVVGADGLSVQSFRDGSAYQGEDLIQDPEQPARFLLRCTRNGAATPAMCLHERRLGGADVTVRFPRAWLADWRGVADGIDRLLTSLRPTPLPE